MTVPAVTIISRGYKDKVAGPFVMKPSMSHRERGPRSCGARTDSGLPPYRCGTDRAQLPAPADLLELRRRGGRPLWFVGRRLDDAGAALSVPPLRGLGARFRAGIRAGSCALVLALALRALARHQLRRRGHALAPPLSVSPHARRAQALTTVRAAAALRGSCASDKSWHRFAAPRRAAPPEGAIPDRPAKLTCIRRQRVSTRSE